MLQKPSKTPMIPKIIKIFVKFDLIFSAIKILKYCCEISKYSKTK